MISLAINQKSISLSLKAILENRWTIYFIALGIFFIYLPNVSPVHSWASAGVDHFDFVYAAKHHLVPHSTGFPVYMIPANLILLAFPESHPAWILSLTLSTIPAVINIVLIFFITKTLIAKDRYVKYKLYIPYIAALSLASANLVLAQAFIVEVYTYSIMFLLITLLFHVRKQYWLAAIFMGLSLGTHGLIMSMMGFLGLASFRNYVFKLPLIFFFAITPYLYIPWAQANATDQTTTTLLGSNWEDYIAFFRMGSSIFWWGTLPMWEIPERLLETFTLLCTGIGLTTLGLFLSLKNDFKRYWWIWFVASATLYYWLTVTVKITHVHFALALPLMIIVASIGVRYSKIHPKWYLLTSVIMIGIIPFFWNIGVSIDPNLSAQTYLDSLEELEEENKQQIILNMSYLNQGYRYDGLLNDGTAIWWAILDFNYGKENSNIISIFPDRYTEYRSRGSRDNIAHWYRKTLRDEHGIATPHSSISYNHDTGKWYILWNEEKEVLLDEDLYERGSNTVGFWVPDIHQFQLWLTADLLYLENSSTNVRLVERSGTRESIINDLKYNRNLIPEKFLSALEQLYKDANYETGINSFSKTELSMVPSNSNTRNNNYSVSIR